MLHEMPLPRSMWTRGAVTFVTGMCGSEQDPVCGSEQRGLESIPGLTLAAWARSRDVKAWRWRREEEEEVVVVEEEEQWNHGRDKTSQC
jgi:hypothetical protein